MANTTDDTNKPRGSRGGRGGERGRTGSRNNARGGPVRGGKTDGKGAGDGNRARSDGGRAREDGAGGKPRGAGGGKAPGKAPGKSFGKSAGAGRPARAGAGRDDRRTSRDGAEREARAPRERSPGGGRSSGEGRAPREDSFSRDTRAPRDDRAPRGPRTDRAPRAERPDRERRPPRDGEARPTRARTGERSARPEGDRRPSPAGRSFGGKPGAARPGAGPRRPADRKGPARPAKRPPPAAAKAPDDDQRIAKVMARVGVASRRDAEAMIEAGRVTLNGTVLGSPAVNVKPTDIVTVDGKPIPLRERTRLWLFHKPRGLVTTARDPEGRPTVFDRLPADMPRVVAIGRLDINTEGLLLLTNDGGLARVVAHPDTGWLRRYRVRAYGAITQDRLDALSEGVVVDGMEYGPIEAKIDRAQGDNVWLTLGLREGKNREVKRVLESFGLDVNRLIRLSFGPFQLGDLKEGAVEEVRTKVLKDQLGESLATAAGADFDSPIREPEPVRPARRPDDRPASRAASARDRAGYAERPAPGAKARKPSDKKGPGRDEPAPDEKKRPSWDKQRTSIWRAEEGGEGDAPRKFKVKRGAETAKAERAAGGGERTRVGKIASKTGKVLVEKIVRGKQNSDSRRDPSDRPRGGGSGKRKG